MSAARANEEMEIDEEKKAFCESYLDYMMIPESTIHDYEIIEAPEELEREEKL